MQQQETVYQTGTYKEHGNLEQEITFDVRAPSDTSPFEPLSDICDALSQIGYVTNPRSNLEEKGQHHAFVLEHRRRTIMHTDGKIILKEKVGHITPVTNGMTRQHERETIIPPTDLTRILGSMMGQWTYLAWWDEYSYSREITDPTDSRVYRVAVDRVLPHGKSAPEYPFYRAEIEYVGRLTNTPVRTTVAERLNDLSRILQNATLEYQLTPATCSKAHMVCRL